MRRPLRHGALHHRWRASALLPLGLITLLQLSGCGATVRLIPEPLACNVADSVLDQRCAAPSTLADGASYGDLLKAGIDDRAALRSCARHDRLLADTLRECKLATERYKATIQQINATTAAKP